MSYVRSAGYTMKDPDDDAALQVIIGDLERISIALYKGTPNAAYSLTPSAAANIGDSSGQAPDVPIVDLSGLLEAANNLSDVSNAATSRTNLGLGSIATQASSAVSISGGTITGITDLAVADGGTGASTNIDARTNLGLGTLATLSTIVTANITDAQVTDAKLRSSAALSVIGRSANSIGVPADIAAASDGQVLRRSGTSIAFGAIGLGTTSVTGTLPLANGGTGQITAQAALKALNTGMFGDSASFVFTSYIVAGSGVHTFAAATRVWFAVIIGGGGGGAGGSTALAGGGGASGEIIYVWGQSAGSDTSNYIVGASGAAGSSGPGPGGAGGSSLFGAPTQFTAAGGDGGTTGRGGQGVFITNNFSTDGVILRIPSLPGQDQRVMSVNFVASTFTMSGGRGANSGGGYGRGGNGRDNTGGVGIAGTAGAVFIYEF